MRSRKEIIEFIDHADERITFFQNKIENVESTSREYKNFEISLGEFLTVRNTLKWMLNEAKQTIRNSRN